jgi:hypothetical protein
MWETTKASPVFAFAVVFAFLSVIPERESAVRFSKSRPAPQTPAL